MRRLVIVASMMGLALPRSPTFDYCGGCSLLRLAATLAPGPDALRPAVCLSGRLRKSVGGDVEVALWLGAVLPVRCQGR
jgi:hypothetical protein